MGIQISRGQISRGWGSLGVAGALFSLLMTANCQGSSEEESKAANAVDTTGNRTQSVEWLTFHTEVPTTRDDFRTLISGLIGADGQAGKLIGERELVPGVFIGASADPSTPDQSQVRVSFNDDANKRHSIAVAPASYQLGNVFLATCSAAMAKMTADAAANKARPGEAFNLEYRVNSTQGGRLTLALKGDAGAFTFVVDVSSPAVSLNKDTHGQTASKADAFDSVAGTVWFELTKDHFDYFANHAYGEGAVGRQNFNDFGLVPFEWLRLSVVPQLDQQMIDINYEVLAEDGKRIPFAKAPASLPTGAVFQKLVSRSMASMLFQEKTKPGSSTPWSAPFYYDSPVSGGVVQVIAEGRAGKFRIAYALETPRHVLKDVPYIPYPAVEFPKADPKDAASCDKLGVPGVALADRGVFELTIKPSDVIRKSAALKNPLKGKVTCGIYSAKDVTVTGPRDGAVELEAISVDADFDATPAVTATSKEFYAGDYQILCYQDVDANGNANPGDPVTLPIGAIKLACNRNPVTVELSIVYPENR